ncbi:MAG: LysM peptidoglycan-binding domain-containing protein [Patescibacteria group bacterium]
MGRKKSKKSADHVIYSVDTVPAQTGTFSKDLAKINFSESYVSLTLGVLVVLFAVVLLTVFLKANYISRGTREVSSQNTTSSVTEDQEKEMKYTVVEGDDLKEISRKFYATDEFYLEIVKANNIQNPDAIEVGTILTIPKISSRSFGEMEKISGDTYAVKENEFLWDIAVRSYGDGFRWTDIAKANNMDFPDILPAGTILKIPR